MQTKNIIIVGAGPAGLATAIELKRISQYNVIVLEKNPEISYKICAGGIDPDISEIDMPEEIINRKFNKIKFFTPKQSLIIKKDEPVIATVNRKTLHEIMATQALEAGVKIFFNKHVKKIDSNSIIVSSGETFKFDYLVGADGSNSTIRKKLGVRTKKILTAFQYMIPGKYSDIEFYLDFKKFRFSYAWIFPQKDIISVGTGYDPNLSNSNFTIRDLRENFDNWCKKKFNLENAKFEASSINYDYRGFKFENIFLAGDAAGLASGFTGEGIKFAILSGRDIAKKIVDPDHKCREIENILKIKKRGENFIKLVSYNEFLGKEMMELFTFFLKTRTGEKIAEKLL
ncbi:NAD(P)/FAD-dependent oxidoreductase [Candidatus Parcubacteria bacterium]|nr:NAD(P)/FAD-dependent oxidoreductase [Candidatus Parcubacteria bacterium]